MRHYIAKTFQGLEPVLAQELQALGATDIEQLRRAVSFRCTEQQMYQANMSLRTALRILMPLAEGQAADADALYKLAYDIDWPALFSEDKTFAVYANVSQAEAFRNSIFAALKAKDAIADRFREASGRRPFVDKENPDIRIYVHIFRENLSISLDTSGESLHKRGYRRGGHPAPLNEVLAAGIIALSGWDGQGLLLDPMCGSGTLCIEAALWASRRPPNLQRQSFALKHWSNFNEVLWDKAWLQARKEERSIDATIFGFDILPAAVQEAKANALNAGFEEDIIFSKGDFFEKPKSSLYEEGLILLNPPYGERLEQERDMQDFYRRIGDRLKQEYKGFEAHLLSSNSKALRHVGLRPEKKTQLFNGPLEVQLSQYKLF